MSAGSGAKWPALTSRIHHQTAPCLQTISLTVLSLIFYLKHSLHLYWMIMRMCDWTTLIPCCQLHLRRPVMSPLLSAWLCFSLLTKNMPKLNDFPSNFQPWLHLIRKLEKCLLLTQMADDQETPSREEKYSVHLVPTCFSLGCLLFSHSVTSSTLGHSMDCSMPGLLVLHYCPELAQTHVHWVSNAIQPSCPLSSPSPPAFSPSQHQT